MTGPKRSRLLDIILKVVTHSKSVLSASVPSVLTKQRLFDRAGKVYTEVWLAYSILISAGRLYAYRAWLHGWLRNHCVLPTLVPTAERKCG